MHAQQAGTCVPTLKLGQELFTLPSYFMDCHVNQWFLYAHPHIHVSSLDYYAHWNVSWSGTCSDVKENRLITWAYCYLLTHWWQSGAVLYQCLGTSSSSCTCCVIKSENFKEAGYKYLFTCWHFKYTILIFRNSLVCCSLLFVVERLKHRKSYN